ncbi:MAG: hypothetical protein ACO1QR_11335 [Chthoniobacteraceae bacterium]
MSTPNPRTVAPNTSKRDTIIAVVAGLLVLALIVLGMSMLNKSTALQQSNQLTGEIVAKNDAGQVEKEISVGRKGLKSKEVDSGFSFDIRVEKENRTYTVPVNRELFESKKVGDTQSFIRPPSEQR